MRFGETIPGTYILADITAKGPVFHLSLKFGWDFFF
jgi:hypothetical protein